MNCTTQSSSAVIFGSQSGQWPSGPTPRPGQLSFLGGERSFLLDCARGGCGLGWAGVAGVVQRGAVRCGARGALPSPGPWEAGHTSAGAVTDQDPGGAVSRGSGLVGHGHGHGDGSLARQEGGLGASARALCYRLPRGGHAPERVVGPCGGWRGVGGGQRLGEGAEKESRIRWRRWDALLGGFRLRVPRSKRVATPRNGERAPGQGWVNGCFWGPGGVTEVGMDEGTGRMDDVERKAESNPAATSTTPDSGRGDENVEAGKGERGRGKKAVGVSELSRAGAGGTRGRERGASRREKRSRDPGRP